MSTFLNQIEWDIGLPPVLAALYWVLASGWTMMWGVYGESEKRRLRRLAVFVLVLCWVGMFTVTLYGHFVGFKPRIDKHSASAGQALPDRQEKPKDPSDGRSGSASQ